MVQLMRAGNRNRGPVITHSLDKHPVKLESEDSLDDDHSPFTKRSRISPTHQKWCAESKGFLPLPPSKCNPLEEPSPLGLRLRKSPSLLDLIHLRLSQASPVPSNDSFISSNVKNDSKGGAMIHAEKLKASNFSASLLRIGHWEYVSRYEGDLVAKCYFAKHKLVWEVLEGGLKSKLEIQWSDIMGLKANCPEIGPGTLNVVLARQPLFFRETNPQPRKHTLWQATADFTNGQASIHREHFLQCPQGLLNRHFEKLTQCDMRLHFLSQQHCILDSPLFDHPHDHSAVRYYRGKLSSNLRTAFRDEPAPPPHPSWNVPPVFPEDSSGDSPISTTSINVERDGGAEERGDGGGEEGERRRVSDIVSEMEKQMAAGSSVETAENWKILQDIACHLLSDVTTVSDEKSLMARVSSLCSLLQKDPPPPPGDQEEGCDGGGVGDGSERKPEAVSSSGCTAEFKPSFGDMSRKDSLAEVLLHLPTIASLPDFLFNLSEDVSGR